MPSPGGRRRTSASYGPSRPPGRCHLAPSIARTRHTIDLQHPTEPVEMAYRGGGCSPRSHRATRRRRSACPPVRPPRTSASRAPSPPDARQSIE
jgi:hypothetical protein